MGISYLASYLEHHGIPADILDINIELYTNAHPKQRRLWQAENYSLWTGTLPFRLIKKIFIKEINIYAEKILKEGYRIIGFSLFYTNTLFSLELARVLKRRQPDILIIFGGPNCYFLNKFTDFSLKVQLNGKFFVESGLADFFVVGEGEEALLNIVKNYFSRDHSNSGAVDSSPYINYPFINDLDRIAYPSWEKFSLNLYASKKTLPIIMSRGCINRCSFCTDWLIWGSRFRIRSAMNIFQEMRFMIEKFKIDSFNFHDSLINGNLKVLEELADHLIANKLKISFSGEAIIRKEMSLSLLKKLRRSGLTALCYGVESLSEAVLKKMGKGYSFRDICVVLTNTRKARIKSSIHCIIGFPNEDKKEFEITKKRLLTIKDLIESFASINVCFIPEFSQLDKNPKQFSILTSSKKYRLVYWKSRDGRNTYEVRKKRALELFAFAKRFGIQVNSSHIGEPILQQ